MNKAGYYLWRTSDERSIGYLLMRVFIGCGILTHGIPKIAAGPRLWETLGQNVTGLGVPGPAVFWGFMSAFAESFGAMLLVLGLLTPAAALLIVVNMGVAAFVAHQGGSFAERELPLIYFFSALLFMLKGGGHYAVDRFLPRG